MNIVCKAWRMSLLATTSAGLVSSMSLAASVAQFQAAGNILVCDQTDQAIGIYDASGVNVWRWSARDDDGIPGPFKMRFAQNVAEAKPFDGGRKIGMVACGGAWAVVDRSTHKAAAWGTNDGWGHSIECVGNDVVAVVSTGGTGGNSLFLFDIYGEAARNPKLQKTSRLRFDSPHGLHYDGKSLWVLDAAGLHRCSVSGGRGKSPTAKVEEYWPFAPLGVTGGHDLRPVPRSALLALTTHEKILFFDLSAKAWREKLFISRGDVKGFDPFPDGKSFLVTSAKTQWWTDSLELCTMDFRSGRSTFKPFRTLPGRKIYKARFAGEFKTR